MEFGSEEVTRTAVTVNNVTTKTETEKFQKSSSMTLAPTTPALEQVIKELFTGSKFLIDYERNLVVARGTEEQLQVMEKIIEEFDRPVQQVLIEARFVTVSGAWPCTKGFVGNRPLDGHQRARAPSARLHRPGFQRQRDGSRHRHPGDHQNVFGRDTLTATITA